MQFKYIIIIVFSFLSAQSQFNPIIGQSLDMGSVRSFSMGHTYMSFPNSSSVVLSSPSSMLSIDNKSSLQANYSLANHSYLERRSIPMKDNFGDFLTYGDYASNRSTYQYHHFGLLYLNKSIGLGINYGPLISYNYNFSEEVRTRYYASDGEIVSKDPLSGFHTMKSLGTINAISLGLAYKFNFLSYADIGLGLSYNYVLKDTVYHQFEVDALSSQINYLSPVQSVELNSGTNSQNYFVGDISIFISSFRLIMGYENSFNESSYNIIQPYFDSDLGFFKISQIESNETVIYNLSNISIYKPEKYRFGLTYSPKTYPKTNIAFESEFENYYKSFNNSIIDNVLKWKFGIEYYVNNKLPIRLGFLYTNHPIKIIPAETRFTLGSTININKRIFMDYGLEYFINQFQYPDLFPVLSENRLQYDQIIESTFNVKFGFGYQF